VWPAFVPMDTHCNENATSKTAEGLGSVGKLLTMSRPSTHLSSLAFWVPRLATLSNDDLRKVYIVALEAMAKDLAWEQHLRATEKAMLARNLEL
jgi:hypothetical protein